MDELIGKIVGIIAVILFGGIAAYQTKRKQDAEKRAADAVKKAHEIRRDRYNEEVEGINDSFDNANSSNVIDWAEGILRRRARASGDNEGEQEGEGRSNNNKKGSST